MQLVTKGKVNMDEKYNARHVIFCRVDQMPTSS